MIGNGQKGLTDGVLTSRATGATIGGENRNASRGESESRKVHRCKQHRMPVVTVDCENRVLIITTRHRGEDCENVIPLVELGLQPIPPTESVAAPVTDKLKKGEAKGQKATAPSPPSDESSAVTTEPPDPSKAIP